MKKATRSILSAAVAVSLAATACPVSFAATTSNEVQKSACSYQDMFP